MTLPGQNHNMASKSERYTPPWIVELARKTMDRIDLDPCSCEKAQEVVKAGRWIGLPDDGLVAGWKYGERVFVNPPGAAAVCWHGLRGASTTIKRTY